MVSYGLCTGEQTLTTANTIGLKICTNTRDVIDRILKGCLFNNAPTCTSAKYLHACAFCFNFTSPKMTEGSVQPEQKQH